MQPAAAAISFAAPAKSGHHKPTASSAASTASTAGSQRSRPVLSVQAQGLPVDKNRPVVASPVTPQSSAVAVVKKHAPPAAAHPADRGAHAKRMHQAAMAALGKHRTELAAVVESASPTRRSPRHVTRRMSVTDRSRDNSDPDRDDDSQNALSETSLPVDALDGLQSPSPVASTHRSVLGFSSPLRSTMRRGRRDSIMAPAHTRSDTPDGEMLTMSPAKQYSSLRGILSPRHGLAAPHSDLSSHGLAGMGLSPADAGGYRGLGGHDGDEGLASAATSTYSGALSGPPSPLMHGHPAASRRSSRASLLSGGGGGSNSSLTRSRRIGGHFGETAEDAMAEAAGLKRAELPELL